MKLIAIAYVRVSTEEQAMEGMSLEAQKHKVGIYAELKGMELIKIISDEGKSAKDLKRPGIIELFNLIDNGNPDGIEAVIVYKLDRIFRSTIDSLETMMRFKNLGVSLHSIQESFDTDSAFGRFFFTILSALGQMERELIGERTKSVIQHMKETGKVYGPISYGFRRIGGELVLDKKTRKMKTVGGDLVKDGREQRTIKYIKWLHEVNNMGYTQIANALNLSAKYLPRKGEKWFPQQIKNILLKK